MAEPVPYTVEALGDLQSNCLVNIRIKPKEDTSSDVSLLRQISVTAPSMPCSSVVPWIQYWKGKDIKPPGIFNIPGALVERLTNPLYGRDILDMQLEEMASTAPGIDEVWKITQNWPSLTKILLEDRGNE